MGFLAGVKIGGLAAVGGSILGYTGASVVSEHRELREYIDEHYEKEPELYVQSPREEALAKRRSSRTLPETPGGPGVRALGSAKYRNGPNGYRRPSLVRASSLESRGTGRSSIGYRGVHDGAGRVGSVYSVRGSGRNMEGMGRRLPSRPSYSRTSYTIEQGAGWHSRGYREGARRPPLLRHNSNLHRKMSYRHSNNNMDNVGNTSQNYVARQPQSSYRRYGGQEANYQDLQRREAWSLSDFQRSASIEERNYVLQGERRRFLMRQEHVSGSSMSNMMG